MRAFVGETRGAGHISVRCEPELFAAADAPASRISRAAALQEKGQSDITEADDDDMHAGSGAMEAGARRAGQTILPVTRAAA